jgi:hypothetical protein
MKLNGSTRVTVVLHINGDVVAEKEFNILQLVLGRATEWFNEESMKYTEKLSISFQGDM